MEDVNNNQLFKEILNALQSKNVRLIILLLKSGNIGYNDWIEDSGVTIVHLAAGHRTESFATTLIDIFIKDGADPNVPSLDQMTPVHVAAAWGHVSVLNILLLHGGDPWLQNDEKRNAYNYAFEAKAWSVVELLHNFQLANIASKKDSRVSPNKYLYKNEQNIAVDSISEEINEDYFIKNYSDHKCLLANIASQKDSKVSPTEYKNKQNASVLLQSEDINETYFYQNFSDQSCTGEIFVSSAEIIPIRVNKLVIEAEDVKSLHPYKTVKKYVDSSQFSKNELKVKGNDSNPIPNILSETYTIEKKEHNEILQTNLFSELLAAVKRRSDRLAKQDTTKCSNQETRLANNFLSSGIAAIAIGKSSISDLDIKEEKLLIFENKSQDSSSNKEIGDDVKLLILESNKEEIKVIDISDSGSSFLSLTDSDEKSLASSLSFMSCSGSPESNRFIKNNDDEADNIRSQLLGFGVNAGPITPTTKAVYVRILRRLQERGKMVNPLTIPSPSTAALESPPVSYYNSYCTEIEEAVRDNSKLKQYASLEAAVRNDFDSKARTWRGGTAKTSFNYLLLDSRITRNLPQRASEMSNSMDVTREFLNAVFYIGKGQGNRPYAHLHEAFQSWQHGSYPKDPKEALILDIWRAGAGVVCLPIFHNTIPAEAFTREAAMIDALGRHHVRNLRRGEYYGDAAYWSPQQKRMLGAFLLLTSKDILLRDGERVLRPCDL